MRLPSWQALLGLLGLLSLPGLLPDAAAADCVCFGVCFRAHLVEAVAAVVGISVISRSRLLRCGSACAGRAQGCVFDRRVRIRRGDRRTCVEKAPFCGR